MNFSIPKTKYSEILKIIDQFQGNDINELEVRLNKSVYNIDYYKFKKILSYLTFDKLNGGQGFDYKTISILDIQIDEGVRYSLEGLDNIKKYWLLNSLDGLDYSKTKKTRLKDIDLNEYAVRFSLSEEKELKIKGKETIIKDIKKYRFKNRYEILSDDNLVRFDLTVIKSADSINDIFKKSEIENKIEEYEIEVEALHTKEMYKLSSKKVCNKLVNYIYYYFYFTE